MDGLELLVDGYFERAAFVSRLERIHFRGILEELAEPHTSGTPPVLHIEKCIAGGEVNIFMIAYIPVLSQSLTPLCQSPYLKCRE